MPLANGFAQNSSNRGDLTTISVFRTLFLVGFIIVGIWSLIAVTIFGV